MQRLLSLVLLAVVACGSELTTAPSPTPSPTRAPATTRAGGSDQSAVPIPASLAMQTVTRALPTLTWAAAAGAIGYEVQVISSGGTIVMQAIRVQTTTLSLPLGQPAGPYTWRVRGCSQVVPGAPVLPTETACANGAPASAWAVGSFER